MSNNKSRLLQNRGIGKKYHSMTLTEYPHPQAQSMVTWLEEEASRHLSLGKGVVVTGVTQASYDIALLFARASVLTGQEKLRCYNFQDALDYDTVSLLWQEKYPILITNFDPRLVYTDPERYKRLENLLNYYVDNNIPLYLHIPIKRENIVDELINPVLLDRVVKNSKVFEVE